MKIIADKTFFTYTLVSLIAFLFSTVFCEVNISFQSFHIYVLAFLICVGYLLALYLINSKIGITSLTGFFWLCLGLFSIGRIFLFLFTGFDFMHHEWSLFREFDWKRETAIAVLGYYYCFIIVFTNVVLGLSIDKNIKSTNYHFSTDNNPISYMRKPIYLVFGILTPFAILYYLKYALAALSSGYTSIYNGGIAVSGFLKLAKAAFEISFYFICSFEDDKKRFKIITSIYLLVNAITFLQGSRGNFIVKAMAVYLLSNRLFDIRIRKRWIILFGALGIPMLVAISNIRQGLFSIDILQSYSSFIVDLSGSLNIPAYYYQNVNALSNNPYPYVLEPIIRVFFVLLYPAVFKNGQTMDMIDIRYNLSHQITYHISSNYYLAGSNVGNNFIAEMMEFGYLGVILGSIIFAIIVLFIEGNLKRNHYFRFMTIELTYWILIAPRGTLFMDTYNLLKFTLIYFFVYFICKTICSYRKTS